MAHFAKLGVGNIVEQVIVVDDGATTEDFAGNWIETSHNIRKQMAGIGYKYDEVNDVFIRPQDFPSWTLDENFDWQPPTAMPADGPKSYMWDEDKQEWVNYWKAEL